ncbi:MAG: hypothetical protein JJT82_08145 [Legionellaceae bacterium]|nr:hypothetical protein [Legionellaceae bacterium]
MAFAISKPALLSNHLRFLLFEIGIALSPAQMDAIVLGSSRKLMAAMAKIFYGSAPDAGAQHPLDLDDFITHLQDQCYQSNPASRFYPWLSISEAMKQQWYILCLQESWQIHRLHQYPHRAPLPLDRKSSSFIQRSQLASLYDTSLNSALVQFLRKARHEPRSAREGGVCLSKALAPPRAIRELLQYQSPFNAAFKLHWLAIAKNDPQQEAHWRTQERLLSQYFPHDYHQWRLKLHAMGYRAADYWPVPIHPYYWRKLRAALEDAGHLLLIPHLQTVHCLNHLEQLISESENGPLLSFHLNPVHALLNPTDCHRLNQVSVASTPDRLTILECIHATPFSCQGGHTLSVYYQKNPLASLAEGESLIPSSSLCTAQIASPGDSLAQLLGDHHLDARSFFKKYSKILIQYSLRMLLQQGIALSLDASSCVLQCKKNSRWTILACNPYILKFCSTPSDAQPDMETVYAHWRFHLFNRHLIPLLEYIAKEVGPLAWDPNAMMVECITTELKRQPAETPLSAMIQESLRTGGIVSSE